MHLVFLIKVFIDYDEVSNYRSVLLREESYWEILDAKVLESRSPPDTGYSVSRNENFSERYSYQIAQDMLRLRCKSWEKLGFSHPLGWSNVLYSSVRTEHTSGHEVANFLSGPISNLFSPEDLEFVGKIISFPYGESLPKADFKRVVLPPSVFGS